MNPRTIKAALGQSWRTARAQFAGSAIVLTYHRVANLSADPQRLAIDVDRFDEHMRLLSASHNMMTAGALFELMAHRKRVPNHSVVVTIDDGYSDALLHAKPILDKYSVPATVFVSSDYIGGHSEFWWDEIERLVLCGEKALPRSIEIEVNGGRFSTHVAEQSAGAQQLAGRGWDVTRAPETDLQRIYLKLCAFILPLSRVDRAEALSSLRAQLGAEALVRPSHRPLLVGELRTLAGGLVEIGAHTESHQVLAARAEPEQRDEIVGSKQALERILGEEIQSFSYPYGGVNRYSEQSARLVRQAGFLGACSTEFGIVLPWADRFAVPRCPTENIGGEEFLARVARWFEAGR